MSARPLPRGPTKPSPSGASVASPRPSVGRPARDQPLNVCGRRGAHEFAYGSPLGCAASLDDDHVIDANVAGNAARWINHACEPNCQADEVEGRVFVHALRDLQAGEELFYDYGLIIDLRYTPKLKREYECRCGSMTCRHTMLAPKR